MGGCATKPKVTKDNAPEPAKEDTPKAIADHVINLEKKAAQEQNTQDYTEKLKVDEVVHDDKADAADVDQANRRRSLSSLFQDNQSEGKDSTEDKKTEKKELGEGEEKSTGENQSNEYETTEKTVQQETSETEKPEDESQSNESEKQESSGESQSNEGVEQEPSETDHQEKPSEESESKETLKQEPTEAKKPNEDSGTVEETTTADDVVPEKLVEVMTEAADTEKISKEKLTDEESGAVTVSASTEDKNQTLDSVVDQNDETSKVEVNQ